MSNNLIEVATTVPTSSTLPIDKTSFRLRIPSNMDPSSRWHLTLDEMIYLNKQFPFLLFSHVFSPKLYKDFRNELYSEILENNLKIHLAISFSTPERADQYREVLMHINTDIDMFYEYVILGDGVLGNTFSGRVCKEVMLDSRLPVIASASTLGLFTSFSSLLMSPDLGGALLKGGLTNGDYHASPAETQREFVNAFINSRLETSHSLLYPPITTFKCINHTQVLDLMEHLGQYDCIEKGVQIATFPEPDNGAYLSHICVLADEVSKHFPK